MLSTTQLGDVIVSMPEAMGTGLGVMASRENKWFPKVPESVRYLKKLPAVMPPSTAISAPDT